MATQLTTVTGTYLSPLTGAAIAGAYIKFRLIDVGADDSESETFARIPVEALTDASGDFSVSLWNSGSSDIDKVYEVRFPDGRTKQFIIPIASAGGTIDLAKLLALHQPTTATAQAAVQDNLDNFAADPTTNTSFSPSEWRSNLGLVVGTDVQAYSTNLDSVDQDLATTDNVNFAQIQLGTSSGDLLETSGSGDIGIRAAGGRKLTVDASGVSVVSGNLTLSTDLAITEGGTGASTASGARTNLGFITATATLDFPSISSNSQAVLTMTVTGAAVGDAVILGAPSTIENDLNWSGFVSATDTVSIRLHHTSGGAIDPASATWKATVISS